MDRFGDGHQHTDSCDGDGCERLTAEGEVASARLIADGGDLEHAANHVAGAVGTDPALPEAYEALAELVARAGGAEAALELFPTRRESYTGTLACRAALLAAVGRPGEAVALLGRVIGAAPHLPWAAAAWLVPLARWEAAAELDTAEILQALPSLTMSLDDPVEEALADLLAPYYAVVHAVAETHPDALDFLATASSLARRLNDFDTAVAWATAARDATTGPHPLGVVMLGSALRRAGRVEEALAVWQEAVDRDPTQTHLAVDIAELYAETGRPEQGIAILERVLDLEPDHEKAGPSLHWLRHRIDPDARHLVALQDHLRQYPDHDYAGYLLQLLCDQQPWLDRIPAPTEAITDLTRQLARRDDLTTIAPVVSLTSLEPPSATLAARSIVPALTVDAAESRSPDLRLPTRPVEVTVWRYEGLTALPAVPPPSARARTMVADFAQLYWNSPPALYDGHLPLGQLPAADLLGVLVHPPAPAAADWPHDIAREYPDMWLRAVQVAACMGIAHHRPDQPWPTSDRRRILLDLLDGPEDWVCEAAGMALATTGWMFPETRDEIADRLAARTVEATKAEAQRPCEILRSLVELLLICGWLDAATVGKVRALRDRLLAEGEGDRVGDTGEGAAGDREPAAAGRAGAGHRVRRRLFGRR